MLVIIFQIFLIFWLLKKHIQDEKKIHKIYNIFILGIIFQCILLIIYRLNLYYIGRTVYFSDAETYWEATKTLLSGGQVAAYNRLYYTVCFFIQKVSPFIWVGWNNIFNILCIDLCAVLTTIVINKNKSEKQIYYFLYFTLFNPLIYYSLMRNLKDALFIFMVFLLGYFLESFLNKKNNAWLFILISLLSIPLFYNIRPWAFIIPIIAILVLFLKKYQSLKKYKMPLILSSILIFFLVILLFGKIIWIQLKVWTPIVLENFLSRGIVDTILGVGKIFVGPGFIHALFGMQYFEHYTLSGNIMIAIGGLMWYFVLSLFIFLIRNPIKNIKESSSFTKYLILFFVCFVGIYVMQYGGSVETRMRGVLYLTTYSLFFTTFDYKMTKTNCFLAMCVYMVFFIISIVLG